MKYVSTRGQSPPISFSQAVLKGLAPDGGLYVPDPAHFPNLPHDWSTLWKHKSYAQIAAHVLALFIDDTDIPHSDIDHLALRTFNATANGPWNTTNHVTPLHPLPYLPHDTALPKLYILELFHGPTLAFKDIALQFLGNLFEYLLARDVKPMTIIGATSGDTGSAAIAGVRGKSNIRVCILHPHLKVSSVQETQMTTCLDPNVCNVAVDGDFDDCQSLVKQLFNDPTLCAEFNLAAVNSINIARIVAQISYYVYSYLQYATIHGTDGSVVYSVPSGNFGDCLAGYYAMKLGLPVQHLIIGTNKNAILHRFLQSGIYSPNPEFKLSAKQPTVVSAFATHAPAMDITIASNFERILFDWVDGDSNTVQHWMHLLSTNGGFQVPTEVLDRARRSFLSHQVNDQEILETITNTYARTGYILDPHTAVGVNAVHHLYKTLDPAVTAAWTKYPPICLATAHPGKFISSVGQALKKCDALSTLSDKAIVQKFLPDSLYRLQFLPKRCVRVQGQPSMDKIVAVLRQNWPVGELLPPASFVVAKL